MMRQFDAILGTGSLMRFTRRITAPTVVIHGTDDPMVRPRNGRSWPGRSRRAVRRRRRHGPRSARAGVASVVEALTENFAAADGLEHRLDRPRRGTRENYASAAPFVSGSSTVQTRLTSTTAVIMAPIAGTPHVASIGAAMIVGTAPPTNPRG
jgi:hypothetical protein